MSSLLVVIVVAAICVLWVRTTRLSRQRWLARLDLPGIWRWEDNDGVLELAGELDHGQYRLREADRVEQGAWRLEGHELLLEPQGGRAAALDLRFFDVGKIGVHGPGLERRIYVKERGNVVPMRRPA